MGGRGEKKALISFRTGTETLDLTELLVSLLPEDTGNAPTEMGRRRAGKPEQLFWS